MRFLCIIFLLIISIDCFSQRSFYKINEICDLDYDRENIETGCYNVDEIQITRDLNKKQFIFFQDGEKFIIPFSTISEDSRGIGYYYYDILVLGLRFKTGTRIPFALTIIDQKNNTARRYVIKSWKPE
ncbi:hypothetical protein HX088_11280 [Empedobacter sp. 225-1]|uniref:hypothetical protein n=1 Tax=Empedobacter sp. 225-1 TaxID=2746725 RepID=UPI002576E36F|nr:hypothetical protein [Empedobacter sp. 225-1]MDM1523848.1 hypothetical protein [Empedobacter sp. 225-1]